MTYSASPSFPIHASRCWVTVFAFAAALIFWTPDLRAEGSTRVDLVDAQHFQLYGNDAATLGDLTRLPNADGVQGPVYRVQTDGQPSAKWAVQLRALTHAPVRRGDVVYATFKARSGGSMVGDATTEFIFERASPDWEKSASFTSTVGLQWTQVHVPFRAATDLAAGEGHVSFRLGYGGQAIEIAEIQVVNLGAEYDLKSLPMTARTYDGMEADAPWRAAAQKRIEKHRVANLNLRVVDPEGNAVPGAKISVEMTRSDFGFGSAVVASQIASDSADSEKYRQVIADHFNEVVFENDLKWGFNQGDFSNVDLAMVWLEERGIAVRGHCLVWPSWRRVPAELKALSDAGDHDAMRALIAEHIETHAGRYAGRLIDWDVINEVYMNHDVVDVLGESSMVDWFKLAHAADPQARLYINDYGILTAGGSDQTHQAAYEATIRYLRDNGAPIHGIGMQGHFGQTLTPPAKLLEVLDRFAALGLSIKVTEFDISTDDPEMQAAYARDFLTVMYSHPAVDAVVMWGFWEKRHWRPNAAWWREDWSPKPAVEMIQSLIQGQWQTRAQGVSDDRGQYAVRGHLGDYQIIATDEQGRRAEQTAVLASEGLELLLVLR